VVLVKALLADPDTRIVYRPHPRTGTASAAHAAADRRIRQLLVDAGERHLVDSGSYGWQWDFADACITDISAVAYDWLGTGKPLVVTRPAEPRALLPASPLLQTLPLLDADRAGEILAFLDQLAESPELLVDLATYYFGDTRGGASTLRFEAAVAAAVSRSTTAGEVEEPGAK
jgi:hypothetical protein